MDDRKEIRFVHPNGRVLVMTPVPTDPFAWTSKFEGEDGGLIEEIEKNFNEGNCKQ